MADVGVLNIVFLSCGLYPSTYGYHFCQWSGRMSGVSVLSQLIQQSNNSGEAIGEDGFVLRCWLGL